MRPTLLLRYPEGPTDMEQYWYISGAKLDTLKHTVPLTWRQELLVKLKFKTPWLDAEVDHRQIDTAVANIGLIEKALRDEAQPPDFSLLGKGVAPNLIRFRGHAGRMTTQDGYWVVLHHASVGLLLAGSVKHAIGADATPKGSLSPSINPIGAAAELASVEKSESVAENVSYVWQEVARHSGLAEQKAAPTVEGLAVFAGTLPASRKQIRRAGVSLETIVVASPIYIRQVPEALRSGA